MAGTSLVEHRFDLPDASYNPAMRRLRFVQYPVAKTVAGVATFVLFSCLGAMAGKEFVMPTAQAARNYPAHDDHPTEKVVIAVDPYDMADKAQIFTTNYNSYGYLPVFFIVTNDGDQPVALSGMKAQLITVNRTKLLPANTDDLVRRLARPSRNDRPGVQLPIPLPGSKKVKGAVSSKTIDEINRAHFGARSVEPHSAASGFLFFAVADISTPLARPKFFVYGVRYAG